jgi:hypothetical protein
MSRTATRTESDRLRGLVQATMIHDGLTPQAMADRLRLPVLRLAGWLRGETLPGRQQQAVRLAMDSPCG